MSTHDLLIVIGCSLVALAAACIVYDKLTGAYFTAKRMATELNEKMLVGYSLYSLTELRDRYQQLLIDEFPRTNCQIIWRESRKQFEVIIVKLIKP